MLLVVVPRLQNITKYIPIPHEKIEDVLLLTTRTSFLFLNFDNNKIEDLQLVH